MSYVLKTSILETALKDAGIEINTELCYWIPQSGDSIFEAEYWLPNPNVPYPRIHVSAGTVPFNERNKALELLKAIVIPAFIKWALPIVKASKNSTMLSKGLYFNAKYNDGKIDISYKPQYKEIRSNR